MNDDLQAALVQCEHEPIHIPGAVQPHGALLVLDGPALRVVQASTSCEPLLGLSHERLLDHPLAALLGPALAESVAQAAHTFDEVPAAPSSFDGQAPDGRRLTGHVHRAGNRLVLELEPAVPPSAAAGLSQAARLVQRLRLETTVEAKAQAAAESLRAATGYSRVMIYRFHEDWHGEVIAEARDPDLAPYLGLHYPASDIPAQARRLYLVSPTRVIVDVDYVPSPVLPPTDPPLDLSLSVLRSVSPVHLAYLRNMGVRATLVASLVHGDRLWGLIACHHGTPTTVGRATRQFVDLAAQALATELGFAEDAERRRTTERLARSREVVLDAVRSGMRLTAVLSGPLSRDLLDALSAEGAALLYRGEVAASTGRTPAPHSIVEFVAHVEQQHPVHPACQPFHTDCLSELVPQAAAATDTAAGLGLFPLDRDETMKLVWFRGEQLRHVTWGGNPDKAVDVQTDGTLSPRASFDAWTESVRCRSLPWRSEELDSAFQLGSTIDIEWRRIADEAYTLGERLRRDVLDSLGAHVAVLNEHGRVVDVNRAWAEFARRNGGDARCLQGASYLQACRQAAATDPDAQAALQGIGEVLQGTRCHFSLEYPCHARSDERWFLMRVYPLTGQRRGAVVTHEDITQRKQAEAAVRRSEAHYRRLLTIARDGLHLIDDRGVLVESSDAFLEMLGQTRDAIGRLAVPDWDLDCATDAGGVVTNLREGLFERRFRRRDGTELDVEINAGRVEIDGRPLFLSSARDVTVRKQLEARLALRQAQVEELNRSLEQRVETAVAEIRARDLLLVARSRQAAMGEMLSNIAHQWRQPLNGLSLTLADLEDAQRHGELDAEGLVAGLHRAKAYVTRMSATITDFRNFLRPDKTRTDFSLRGEIMHAVSLVQADFDAHGIEMTIEGGADACIHGAPNELSQVLLNLLSNAKDALKSRPREARRVTIRVDRLNGEAVVSVRDTGGGIASALLDRIFDPYFSTRKSGTGIGLYMSRIILEQSLGGRIEARNVDDGAELLITCPLAPEAT